MDLPAQNQVEGARDGRNASLAAPQVALDWELRPAAMCQ